MSQQLTALEIRRLRRDTALVRDIVPGDRRDRARSDERASRGRELLSRLDAPEPERLARGLLPAVGAELRVDPAAGVSQLGYAGEIALAGRSAFAGESDFGAYEVKTSLARDENRAMRLFGWPEDPRVLRELQRLSSVGELALPLVSAPSDGSPVGLVRGPRMLIVNGRDGQVVWRRSWTALADRLAQRIGAMVLLDAHIDPPTARDRVMRIARATVMWQPDASRLGDLIDRGHAGLLVDGGAALAVRRSMLPQLYEHVFVVARWSSATGTLLVLRRPRRARGPAALDDLARRLNDRIARRRHVPAVCACCAAPLAWSAGCTTCGEAAAY